MQTWCLNYTAAHIGTDKQQWPFHLHTIKLNLAYSLDVIKIFYPCDLLWFHKTSEH